MIIAYVTCKDRKEAQKIGKAAVEKKLAACANYFPISSIYEWKGKLEEESEFVLILKTVNDNFERLKEEVKKMHSYDVPCILKIDVEANKEFGDWVKEQVE